MNKNICCSFCGVDLTKDECGINRKILEHDTKNKIWRCLMCLADYLECSKEELEDKIEEFKAEGCKLFG